MSKEEAIELLKNLAEDVNVEEDAYDTHFTDEQTQEPLAYVNKE